MKQNLVRTILKLFPLAAVAASGHIALAAVPVTDAVPGIVSSGSVGQEALRSDAVFRTDDPLGASSSVPASAVAEEPAPDMHQVECMAKVIVHEAGNQPRRGQVAVAQVIRTRMRDGRFGDDACSVVQQRGQFFNVAAYEPSRDDDRWETAVAIARDTLGGSGEEVVPGALFFHSAGASMRGRIRVAQVADHIFYR